MGKKVLLPKTKCCVSTKRCDRCPIRMLKEGTLPDGYGVHKRELVRLDGGSTKVSKADLAQAVRLQQKTNKKSRKKSGKKTLAA